MGARKHRVAIIGAGKVGTAIGVLLSRAGYEIATVCSRHQASADAAAALTGGRAVTDPVAAAREGEIVFLTTPDDAIAEVCAKVASAGGFSAGDCVFHMSGAAGIDVLGPARAAGALVGSIHPMQSFADADGAIETLPGSVFGVTASDEALPVAREIVNALGGVAVEISPEQKVLYHAAACVVSNYLVALADYAEELYGVIGVDPTLARKTYGPLVSGTHANVKKRGPTDALTGPIARGDVSTIRKHLSAMGAAGIDSSPYRMLGQRAVQIAKRRGTIDEATAGTLLAVLREPDVGTTEDARP